MSGTSADGVTGALVDFSARGARVLGYRTFPYPPVLRKKLLSASTLATAELSLLNFELGNRFAEAALSLSSARGRVAVIGSHGQTVWHGPNQNPPNTLQLAEPSLIAEKTGIAVVADFRPRDMAAGGQGAPLMPAFDEFLFSSGKIRAIQNVGGIGNVSIVGGGRLWTAFDTGPGNGLLDLACRLASSGRLMMDKDGRLAQKGRPDLKIVKAMMAHPYFRRTPPKSLDKDDFGLEFLRRHLGRPTIKRLPDILATLSLLTAESIGASYARYSPRKIGEVVLSGGGALNPILRRDIARRLFPIPVVLSDAYGIAVMAKEAACFAWLAVRAIEGKTNNCPAATGARGRRVLGKIIPA